MIEVEVTITIKDVSTVYGNTVIKHENRIIARDFTGIASTVERLVVDARDEVTKIATRAFGGNHYGAQCEAGTTGL